ncbi:helix-turn-helix domain-containing protein [Micromonospora sp. NPDC004704]
MPRPTPVTQADYDRVQELHREGVSRNGIATATGRSGRTVSRIAAELGLSFERSGATAAATEAKKADGAARRAQLQIDALAGALKLMGQMFEPALVYNFGGKENDYNSTTLEQPPFRDKQSIALAIQALAGTALKLAEYDKATGSEDEKGMLGELRDQLRAARDAARGAG